MRPTRLDTKVIREQPDRFAKIGHGKPVFTHFAVNDRSLAKRLGKARLKSDRLAVVPERLPKLGFSLQSHSPVEEDRRSGIIQWIASVKSAMRNRIK